MAHLVLIALLSQLHEPYPRREPAPSLLPRAGRGESRQHRQEDTAPIAPPGPSQSRPSSARSKLPTLDGDTSKWDVPVRGHGRWRIEPAITPNERLYVLRGAHVVGGTVVFSAPSSPQRFDPRGPVPEHATFFWATYKVNGSRPVPIPTPGAGAVVLDVFVLKGTNPVFFRDDAGTWYASGGEFRVRYAVPSTYFAPIPKGIPLPEGTTPPPRLQGLVERFVGKPSSASDLVQRLASYFRSFRVRRLRRGRGGLVERIMEQRVGVCRHRAMIFTALVSAYGIEARYVYNRWHAFSEVRLAGRWYRVDLGGAQANFPRPPRRPKPRISVLGIPSQGLRGSAVEISLDVRGSVPPVVCFLLAGQGRKMVLRGYPSPELGRQRVTLMLPEDLVPGEYDLEKVPCEGRQNE